MPHSCPRPCGRLATAAVFVSVSVVQFIAGLILLKSRYVYLLSGPDFWTAASNLAVGVLLGVSAGVWKDVQKKSFKHIVRRNLLVSLVASSITINSTTAIILILGEGNSLLSIQLENDGKLSSKSEILAYSYATSVCSPIVSVVVAIVFLSGMWFRVGDKGQKTPEIKSILRKESLDDYNWVFKSKQSPTKPYSRIVRKELSFKSLSSSSEEESFSPTDSKFWSNSVHSIEYLKTLSRKETPRARMHRLSKIRHELAYESGKKFKKSPGEVLHETSRMSVPSDGKTIKFHKSSPYSSRKHLENDNSFYPDQIEDRDGNASSMSFEEFKKRHSRKNHKPFNQKKRMSLTEHPVFQQFKHLEGSGQNVHKRGSPEVYIPRIHAGMINESTSDLKSDAYTNPKNQEWFTDENNLESPVKIRGNISYQDVLTEIIRHKKAKFQRTSTAKNLNKSVTPHPKEIGTTDRKVCRTSTTADPSSSKIPSLDISDIQYDSVIDKNESYEFEEISNAPNVTTTPCSHRSEHTVSQVDANTEVDDSFIDNPQTNMLAGEVVKVRVNSLPRNAFSQKLVPVPIPVVSSFMSKSWNCKRREPLTIASDQFSVRNKPGFSSFRGDIKAKTQGHRHIITDGEYLVDQKHETVYDATICEMSPDDNRPPSAAHTSGYASAILENTHLSDSECFKPNLSITNSSNYTPKKKFQKHRPPRNLNNIQ